MNKLNPKKFNEHQFIICYKNVIIIIKRLNETFTLYLLISIRCSGWNKT